MSWCWYLCAGLWISILIASVRHYWAIFKLLHVGHLAGQTTRKTPGSPDGQSGLGTWHARHLASRCWQAQDYVLEQFTHADCLSQERMLICLWSPKTINSNTRTKILQSEQGINNQRLHPVTTEGGNLWLTFKLEFELQTTKDRGFSILCIVPYSVSCHWICLNLCYFVKT